MTARRRRVITWVVAFVAVIGFLVWFTLFRTSQPSFDDDFEHFKYGSVGVEAASGLPYWAWYVMPAVCGGAPAGQAGYARFGFTWEDGKPNPVGMPVMRVGFERIGVNCALCHVGTVRSSAGGQRQPERPAGGQRRGPAGVRRLSPTPRRFTAPWRRRSPSTERCTASSMRRACSATGS